MVGSGEGEARSVYVVQRHFRLVRRGYDPDEVDRHLQVVSEWFRQSRAGSEVRDRERQLISREDAAQVHEREAERLLEDRRLEAEAMLEGARLRANADVQAAAQTLQEAEQQAAVRRAEVDALLERAHAEAARARAAADAERMAILDEARLQAAATQIVREATEQRSS